MESKLRTVSRVMDFETDKRARQSIAMGSLTNSKRPESFVKGVYPTHLLSADGATLLDTAGNKYLDFVAGLGTNLLGYGNPDIASAVYSAYKKGATLSLSSVDEIVLAEKFKEIVPFVERIKLLKTGSEGCTAAVRIARAYNGRKTILRQGYSGWHDEFISQMPPALGVVNSFNIRAFTDIEDIDDTVSAVIIEPVITDYSMDRIRWLKRLRDTCTRNKTVLIFDETITGLRFPSYSVAGWCGTNPDLIIMGKALGGGMPISIVGGLKEIMECGEYFVSSSFAGERISICAATKTISLLQTKFKIQDLWNSGMEFMRRFNEMDLGVKIVGYPTRGLLVGDDLKKGLFMQEACKAGLLFGASWFYSFPLMEKMNSIFDTLKDISLILKIGKIKLEGELPKSPFAQQIRSTK